MDEEEQQQRQEFKQVFDIFDKSGDGSISADELGIVMQALGQNPTEDELEKMIQEVDVDGNREIEFEEFVMLMYKMMNEPDPEEELIEVFKRFVFSHMSEEEAAAQKYNVGLKLTKDNLKRMFDNLGYFHITAEQCEQMVK